MRPQYPSIELTGGHGEGLAWIDLGCSNFGVGNDFSMAYSDQLARRQRQSAWLRVIIPFTTVAILLPAPLSAQKARPKPTWPDITEQGRSSAALPETYAPVLMPPLRRGSGS